MNVVSAFCVLKSCSLGGAVTKYSYNSVHWIRSGDANLPWSAGQAFLEIETWSIVFRM